MTRSCTALLVVFATAFGLAHAAESNWPCFLGPEHTGVAPDANPPLTWSEQSNIKWKVPLPGRGSGSPIVWGDRIYLQTAVKTDRTADSPEESAETQNQSPFRLTAQADSPLVAQNEPPGPRERGPGEPGRRGPGGPGGFGGSPKPTNYYQFLVLCLDRATGKTLWQQTACEVIPHEGHQATSSFASYTPVTDGKNLYVSFGSRGIYSYTLDGEFRWKRDLGKMTIRNAFGEGSSPALFGETLIVNWDHEGQSFIIALDANTGDTKWKKDRDEQTTWLTPLIVDCQGTVQVVVNGSNRARGYDLATGDVLWECGGQAFAPVSTPVAYKNLVFCMTGRQGFALYAIPMTARGDITNSDQVAWKLDRDTSYVPSPLLYEGRLYFLKSINAILSCYTAETGEEVYKTQRLPDMDAVYASPVGAAGRIYVCGRNGVTDVIKSGPEFQVLATNKLDETIDATPALVGKEIILRGEGHLYCIAE